MIIFTFFPSAVYIEYNDAVLVFTFHYHYTNTFMRFEQNKLLQQYKKYIYNILQSIIDNNVTSRYIVIFMQARAVSYLPIIHVYIFPT